MIRRGQASAPRRFRIAVRSAAGALFSGILGADSGWRSLDDEVETPPSWAVPGAVNAVTAPMDRMAIKRR